jgi:hypothetical protein
MVRDKLQSVLDGLRAVEERYTDLYSASVDHGDITRWQKSLRDCIAELDAQPQPSGVLDEQTAALIAVEINVRAVSMAVERLAHREDVSSAALAAVRKAKLTAADIKTILTTPQPPEPETYPWVEENDGFGNSKWQYNSPDRGYSIESVLRNNKVVFQERHRGETRDCWRTLEQAKASVEQQVREAT